MYQKRKEYQLKLLERSILLLESKMKFIEYVIDDKIKVYRQSKKSIIDALLSFEFPFYENNCIIPYDSGLEVKNEYNYLLNLSVYNFTLEKVEELKEDIMKNKNDFNALKEKEIKDIWREELDVFEDKYKKMYC
tara:strand:- start:34 stop:435 length:402 start_codon:yes stop_codon:yes gene_type:complete